MAVGVLVILILILALTPSGPQKIPRYLPGRKPPVGRHTSADYNYNWINQRPFVNDQIWVSGFRDRTNFFLFCYDLRERMIVGELENVDPVVLVNRDGTKLLCWGPASATLSLRRAAANLLQRISGGKLGASLNPVESLWVLDTRNDSAKPVGLISQSAGAGSRWYGSPHLRFGCTRPTAEPALVLFDFESEQLTRLPINGRIIGWWDDQNILLKDANNNFTLYDVVKHQTNTLVTLQQIERALAPLQLINQARTVEGFANWNGREFDFYVAEKEYEFKAKQTFLFKIERTAPTASLKLITPDFQFKWLGHLNASATQYLYPGEPGAPGARGNGAVFLRNLSDNSLRTIVPPDNKGQYAISRFYGNEVIYNRHRTLWRIGLDGSNNAALFPTNSAAAEP